MSAGRARHRRFALGLALIGVSLALFVVLLIVGLDPRPAAPLGADGYSSSGLGHSALLALLAEQGVPLLQSRWASLRRAADDQALVIAEPEPALEPTGGRPSLAATVAAARRLLVVAPKREPTGPARDRPRWMEGQALLGLGRVQGVFQAPFDLTLRREAQGPEGIAWEAPEGWPAPTPADPVQLFEHAPHLEPLVACGAGVLLGRLATEDPEQLVLVLSDPDVLANHGLVVGANAAFALRLIERLREGDRTLVWDETWHGHVSPAHVGRLLLAPPLGYVTASLALLALLALWSGAPRFGGARPASAPIAPGKAFLVANTADLLRAGGHTGHVLRHYAEAAEREAVERLHVGRGDLRAARAGLEALCATRGLPGPGEVAAEVESLLAEPRPDARRLLAAGDRIHRWKEDLLHGRRRDP